MLKIVQSNRFKKDLKLAKKRNYNLNELKAVIDILAQGKKLPNEYSDHSLSGDYNDFRECHIKPDWLLIYSIYDDELELFLLRTGTHSDLY